VRKIDAHRWIDKHPACSVLGLELTDHPLDGGAPSHLFV
jgi:hypothetical protein